LECASEEAVDKGLFWIVSLRYCFGDTALTDTDVDVVCHHVEPVNNVLHSTNVENKVVDAGFGQDAR
jgi:hypothetical protein